MRENFTHNVTSSRAAKIPISKKPIKLAKSDWHDSCELLADYEVASPKSKGGFMKKSIIVGLIVFVVGLLSPQITQAQGTMTYLSNLGQTSTGSLAVGSGSWFAAGFVTGTNAGGYMLNSVQLSVQLGMTNAVLTPNGFAVMLYTNKIPSVGGTFVPGNSLETLNGSTDPATAGIYTYTDASNLILSPSTFYYIVLTAGTPIPFGYKWNFVGTSSYNPNDGWNAGGGLYLSKQGSSWNLFGSDFPQYAINATPVPEPSSSFLLLLGSGVFFYVRRRS